jgi:hypothetical protein
MKGEIDAFSKLPNAYISKKDKNALMKYETRKLMYEESKKHDKVIFDDVDQQILDFFDEKEQSYIIIMYTSLKDLVRNIISRRNTDPRSIFVFNQYSKRYIRTDSNEDSLDSINRKHFIKQLKKMKWEFESEGELIDFANNIFAKMNINDDNDHYIKLRDTYKYNYTVKTHGKNPETIYEELKLKTDAYEMH